MFEKNRLFATRATKHRVQGVGRKWGQIFLLCTSSMLFVLMICGAASAGAVSVKALVEKDNVAVGESFGFRIQVEGTDKVGTPQIGAIDGFSVESLGGQSNNRSSITIINGQMTRNESRGYVFSYRLTAQKAGQFFIPSVPVPVDSQILNTQPVPIKVVPPEATNDFKLELRFSKTSFYVGEPVVLKVIWYISKNVDQFSFHLPILDDKRFFLEDPKIDQKPNKEYYRIPLGQATITAEKGGAVLDGKQYTTLSFEKILTAGEAGTFQIPESTVSCRALVGYSDGEKRRNPFGPFFDDDFFGLGRKGVYKNFAARSGPVALKVMPLPEEGKPDHFSGLVGHYQIRASADPKEVNVGDPITLTLSVSGPEYLEKLELPPFSNDPEFTRRFKIPEEMAAGVVKNGAKVFTQTLRAKDETVKEIPPFKLAYFDPDRREYRVARSEAIPLKVSPTRVVTAKDIEGQAASLPIKSELEALAQGIAYNYEGPEVLENQRFTWSLLVRSPLWITVLTLPLSVYLFLLVFMQMRRKRASDPAGYRSRKALAVFRQRIKELEETREADSEVYANLLNVIRQYLGDKLKMNGSAMTFADVEKPLKSHGMENETLDQLKEIFVLCEQGRYGGSVLTGQSFDELVHTAAEVVQTLDRKM